MTVSSSWVGCSVSRLAAIFSASLFILIHGRDGLAQGGQRDLTMAVLLLAATAFLLAAVRSTRNQSVYAAAFGLLSGIALTIKPTVAPLSLAQLCLAIYTLRKLNRPWRAPTLFAILATLIAPPSPSSSSSANTPSPRSWPASTASSPTTPAWDTALSPTSSSTASPPSSLW
jgi:hypothetical protein